MKDLKAQARAMRMNTAELIELATETTIALQRLAAIEYSAANGLWYDDMRPMSHAMQVRPAKDALLARRHYEALTRMIKAHRGQWRLANPEELGVSDAERNHG